MTAVLAVLAVLLGYLLGAIPTGYLIAKAYGVDIQKSGSGNIGATNVLRTIGRVPALIVIITDPIKGALAMLVANWLGVDMWTLALTGLMAVMGNNFNVFLKFRGGKGVATSIGVGLVIAPAATFGAIFLGVFTIAIGRYVSLGSLIGLVSAALFYLMGDPELPIMLMLIALALLAIQRHHSNISRLAQGNERRLGEKKEA